MTTANKITLVRMCLIPVFMVLLLTNIPYGEYFAVVVFALAAITDGIDGYVARKYSQITTMGKFLDPLADKLLVIAALCVFIEMGLVASWVAMIIITRELVVTSFRIVSINKGVVIAADRSGKMKTLFQILAVLAILLEHIFCEQIFIGNILMGITVVLTVYSGYSYIAKNFDVLDFKKE